jgi:riboflavin kinase/FMN adenylyltransferase
MLVHRGLPRAAAGTSHVVTIGNFDGVHLGHQAILHELRAASLRLAAPSCVVSFEPHPREFFSPHAAPARLTSLREKCALLAQYGVARAQICRFDQTFSRLTAEEFINRVLVRGLGARWVMIGEDFRFGAKRGGDFHALKTAGELAGFEVHAMPTVVSGVAQGNPARVSSSALREMLAAGDVEQAQRMLGRPYSISGRVMHGDKIGRTLGFPTANVQLRHKRPPATGIYAVRVCGLGDTALEAVASMGIRPTVTTSGEIRLEVFIFDFSEQIYGRQVRIDFLKKLRDEEKYTDLETLKRQIALDCDSARTFFATHPNSSASQTT